MDIPAAKIVFPKEDRKAILKEVDEVLKSGRLTLGEKGKLFEENFKNLVKTRYAIAVNSGTASIEIPLRALNVKGKSIIVPTNTFSATAAAAFSAGARVIFADIADDLNLSPESLEERIEKDTAGVILVHIGGNISKNYEKIKRICEDNKLFLFEDAAHAHGSMFKDKYAGNLGIAASFSFYPTKVITSGEGGMITTNNEEINKKSLILRDQGKESFYSGSIIELGYNWRMSELHSILGIYQLKRLEQFIKDRTIIAQIYDKELKNIPMITLLSLDKDIKPNYYKYILFLDDCVDKNYFKKTMKEKYNISISGEVYNPPLHLQPAYGFMNHKKGDFPNAEKLCNRHICLPIYPGMTKKEALYVTNSIKEYFKDGN